MKVPKKFLIIDKILLINLIIFPYLFILAIALTTVESFTYQGFVHRHLIIDIKLWWVLVLIMGIFAKNTFNFVNKETKIKISDSYRFVTIANKLLLPLILVIFIILLSLGPIQDNSIPLHSKLRFYPGTFLYVPILNLFFLALGIGNRGLFELIKFDYHSTKESFVKNIAPLLLLWLIIISIIGSWQYLAYYLKPIIKQPTASYETKMIKQVGPVYDYYLFIDKYTPSSAVIYHPRQQGRWGDVSNEGYSRYFIYPRNLVSEDASESDKQKATYAMLIGRERLDIPLGQDGWPDFKVAAKKIILYPNAPDKPVITLYQDYDPKNFPYPNYWGIIELKKGAI